MAQKRVAKRESRTINQVMHSHPYKHKEEKFYAALGNKAIGDVDPKRKHMISLLSSGNTSMSHIVENICKDMHTSQDIVNTVGILVEFLLN